MSLIVHWKSRLARMARNNDGGWGLFVTKGQLSKVVGEGYSTISDAVNTDKIRGVVKKGDEESKGRVYIPLESAFDYIDTYFHEITSALRRANKVSKFDIEHYRQLSLFDH